MKTTCLTCRHATKDTKNAAGAITCRADYRERQISDACSTYQPFRLNPLLTNTLRRATP